jgi:flagellin
MVIRLDAVGDIMHSSRMLRSAMLRYADASWRLSSGSRIPTAAFDASGLSIGAKLQTQTRGWNQAQRNIQDGISAAQIADHAMDELSRLVGRIRELAVYSANGTLTDPDRQAIQHELDAIRQNIDQVVQGTAFNTNPLLQGQKVQAAPEVDADGLPVPTPPAGAGYTGITLIPGVTALQASGTTDTQTGVYDVRVATAPVAAQVVGTVPATTIPGVGGAAIDLTVTGALGTATVVLNHGDTPAAMIAAINAQSATTGVNASLVVLYPPFPDQYIVLTSQGAGSAQRVSVSAIPDPADPTPVIPSDYTGFSAAPLSGAGGDMTVTINGQAAQVSSTQTTVSLRLNSAGDPADGLALVLTNPPAGTLNAGDLLGNVNVLGFPVQISDLAMPIHSGPNSADEQPLTIKAMTIGAVSLDDANTPNRIGTIDLSTQAGAQAALDVVDAAVTQIGDARAQLGADVNGLERALDAATSGAAQQGEAQSRVLDSDVARDAADLAQAQIVQATATAAIAHTNLQLVASLKLITDSQITVASGAPQDRAQQSGADAPLIGPLSGGPGVGSSRGVVGSGADVSIGGASGLPGSGGFAPLPIIGGGGGFAPMPVLAGSGGLGPSGLSTNEMAGMIANSLT